MTNFIMFLCSFFSNRSEQVYGYLYRYYAYHLSFGNLMDTIRLVDLDSVALLCKKGSATL